MTKPTEEKSLDWHEEECRATLDRRVAHFGIG
jgi:hypothetical protein